MAYRVPVCAGRIITRFSRDTQMIDQSLVITLQMFMTFFMNLVSIALVICIVNPYITIGLVPIAYVFAAVVQQHRYCTPGLTWPVCLNPRFAYQWVQRAYRVAARELKRVESNAKSPIIAHLSETLLGLSTIRAYGHHVDVLGIGSPPWISRAP